MTEVDVIVVGAGPTGLMTAAELTLTGVRSMVLDTRTERNPMSRAGVIHPRTAELFDQRGLLEPVLATGDFPVTDVGHFAGLPVDFRAWPTRHPAYSVPQTKIEEVLEDQLTERGVPVLRGRTVVGLTTDTDGVTVTVDEDRGQVRHRGRYLVAADGAHSTIRKILGVDFPGRPGDSTSVTAEAVLSGVASTRQGLERGQDGHWAIQFPLEGRVRRLIVGGPGPVVPRDAEVTIDELRTSLKAVYGGEVELLEIRRSARISNNARQVTGYRSAHTFLAGDAAHIHLPFGGQGLNTGLGDAVNLGWKLAGAVHGWAPDGLLDTYHAERHPVGARVLVNTRVQSLLLDWAGTGNPDLAPARELLAELLRVPEAGRWLAGMMTGLDIRYPMAGAPDHDLTGLRMPDLDVVVGGERHRIHPLLRDGRGLLLDFTEHDRPSPYARDWAAWADRVDYIRATPIDDVPAKVILVRPDGYVCWVSGSHELQDALSSWFGAPREATTRAAAG